MGIIWDLLGLLYTALWSLLFTWMFSEPSKLPKKNQSKPLMCQQNYKDHIYSGQIHVAQSDLGKRFEKVVTFLMLFLSCFWIFLAAYCTIAAVIQCWPVWALYVWWITSTNIHTVSIHLPCSYWKPLMKSTKDAFLWGALNMNVPPVRNIGFILLGGPISSFSSEAGLMHDNQNSNGMAPV